MSEFNPYDPHEFFFGKRVNITRTGKDAENLEDVTMLGMGHGFIAVAKSGTTPTQLVNIKEVVDITLVGTEESI